MILIDMILTLSTTLIALLVGWYLSRRYYKKTGADLVEEAAKLRHLSTIMLNAMEDEGPVKLNRNEAGEPVGRVVGMSALFEGGSTMSMG
jgi:hypothetical protein